MPLSRIRLELARTAEFPLGSSDHGYDFVAPLDADGHLDQEKWSEYRDYCSVRRFWAGEDDEIGQLLHTRGGRWVFHYDSIDEAMDEPIFALDRHNLVQGEYLSITEHDGVQRPFRIARVTPVMVEALTPRGRSSQGGGSR